MREGGNAGTRSGEFQMDVYILKHIRKGLKIDNGMIENYKVCL